MWKELSAQEMQTIDAGGPLEWWDGIVTIITDRIPDLFRGIKDGWNSK